eukprot:scpid37281/ scgid3278/ Probable RNA-directed DNA polymerase from transposon X-element; Reverse transcriptase
MYVHASLVSSPAPTQCIPGVECIFVRVRIPSSKPKSNELVVCSVYRPPNAKVEFWELFSLQLDNILRQFSNIIVLGDLNTDVLQPRSGHYKHLRNMCCEFDLRNVVTAPTRHGQTCIDLVLVSTGVQLTQTAVHPVDGISDHDLVITHLTYPTMSTCPLYTNIRKPSATEIDRDALCRTVDEQLTSFPLATDVNILANSLTAVLTSTYDKLCPVRRICVPSFSKPKPQPWLTPHLRYLLQQRKHLHRKVRSRPSDQQLMQRYRAVRREGTLLNRRLKSEFLMQQFRNMKRDPRGQWCLLNKLSGRATTKSTPAAPLPALTATFAAVVHDPARPGVLQIPADRDPTAPSTLTDFTLVNTETVEALLTTLNSHKAAGSDGIPPCILKSCKANITASLTSIINQSLLSGVFPASYKHAHVCPLYKAGDATIGSNYRPVSLLPVISKVLEKVVHRQLVAFFDNHPELGALPEEQFAYRRNHSCEDLLAYAINDWQLALDKKQLCGAMFVDMSKAFDRVQHSKLVQELASVGVGGVALRWFADYLTGRTQQVVVGDARGSTEPCSRGVPQGSVLGPLLFCIYIRRTPQKFQHCRALLFADDIAFYVIGRKASTVLRMLQTDLLNLDDFLSERGLVLNPKKSQLLLLRRPTAQLDVIPSITCKGTVIPESSHVLYLGLLLDSSLSFEQQVERVCAKAQCKVASFRHGRRDVSMTGRRMFYLTIVQSTLDYASTCYVHCLSAKLRDKLESTSNRCLRRVFGHDQYTSIDFILTKYNLYTFSRRVNLKLFVFVFRCLSRCTSPLLSTIFTPRSASCRTNAATRGQASAALNLPRATSRYGLNAISFLAADRWNMLPPGCRQAKPLSAFVTSTKSFLGFPVKRQ